VQQWGGGGNCLLWVIIEQNIKQTYKQVVKKWAGMRQPRRDSGGFINTVVNLKVRYNKEFLHQLNPAPWSASINMFHWKFIQDHHYLVPAYTVQMIYLPRSSRISKGIECSVVTSIGKTMCKQILQKKILNCYYNGDITLHYNFWRFLAKEWVLCVFHIKKWLYKMRQ